METFLPILMMPVLMAMTWKVVLTPFGLLRLVPLAVAAVGYAVLHRKFRSAGLGLGVWIFLTYAFDLLAWLFSRRNIAAGAATANWGVFPSAYMAGFPVHLLELPPPPMGADLPPAWEWWVVMVNLIFWSAVSAAVVLTVHRFCAKARWPKPRLGRTALWLKIGALLLNQATCALFFLWFD